MMETDVEVHHLRGTDVAVCQCWAALHGRPWSPSDVVRDAVAKQASEIRRRTNGRILDCITGDSG